MLKNLNRNEKIDLAATALGVVSVVTKLVYYPSQTLLMNGLSVVSTGAWTLIGAEIVKRIVNGPQDARVTTVSSDPA